MPDSQMPPPSAHLVLIRVGIEALVEELGSKRGERFLRRMAQRLDSEERLADVMRIRPRSDDAALAQARREAMAWFRQMLPVWMARL